MSDADRNVHYRNAVIVVGATVIALLPVFFPRVFIEARAPQGLAAVLAYALALALPVGAAWLVWTLLPAPRRALDILFWFVVAAQLLVVHYRVVDKGRYFQVRTNTEWQELSNDMVVRREPNVTPHCYRFLPDSVLQMLQTLTGSFLYSRTVYRLTFGFLLLFGIWRFARFWLSEGGAHAVVLLYALIYPIAIWTYAGQPTDWLSHLSFVVSFLALESGVFVYFALAVTIGALAKETVVAMLGYYLLFHRPRDLRGWLAFGITTAVSLALVVGARLSVPRGEAGFSYWDISGVGFEQLRWNLGAWRIWGPEFLCTVGLLVPFVVRGWRRAPLTPRRLTLFLLPVLFISSTMFSYLHEARNWVPVIVPMAVIAWMGLVAESASADSRTIPPQRE